LQYVGIFQYDLDVAFIPTSMHSALTLHLHAHNI